MPGRSEEERGRQEKEKESRERQVRSEIVQNVFADIEKKAMAQVDVKAIAHSTVGQSVEQSLDCSQIEKRRRGHEEEFWQKEDQMEVQWAEDEKLEKVLERRRMEGNSLQAEVMQRVPELVVHERMSQGKKVKGTKEKKKNVKRWSTEEMKE